MGNAFDKKLLFLFLLLIFLVILLFTSTKEEKVVVVYVSHDQEYSEPILNEFEKNTGIKVKALYDTEATKSVGLVNRLIAEKDRPQADVFWNNEVMRSILLKEDDVLQQYCSPNSADISSAYKDNDCYWTGFAARARVIIYNKEKINVNETPNSIYDFINAKWKGKACISNPLVGSGSTLTTSLFALLGDEKAEELFLSVKKNDVQILEAPSMVRDQVIIGDCWFGSTDTDDAYLAIVNKKPVGMVFPDQKENEIGTLVFPNSVMLIKNSPHPEEGKKLIDFILTPKVEEELAKSALQIPLKSSSKVSSDVPMGLKAFNVTWQKIYDKLNVSRDFTQNDFIS